jgi:dsRNA-specific ribonuclease
VKALVDISSLDTIQSVLSSQSAKIMLMCALFDDNLDEGNESTKSPALTRKASIDSSYSFESLGDVSLHSSFMEMGLHRPALFRDNLSFIGSYSLQFCVTNELFGRYPESQEGGLSLLRQCSLTADAVVYIMMQAGLHLFLYDQDARCIQRFAKEMNTADAIGRRIWKDKGGWILAGGEKEFSRRWKHPHWPTPTPKPVPCYPGLVAGRLVGRNQTLQAAITGDLVFSFKAIIGALVLSLGVNGMWQIIGPLFEETMLLSEKELRVEF